MGELADAPGKARDPAEAARRFRVAWVMRSDEDTLLARALMLEVETGDWAAAETDALFLLRRDADNRAALLALGLLRVREGDDAAAADYLGRLVALGGDVHPIAWVAQSGCLVRLGQARAAIVPAARAGEAACRDTLARVCALDPQGRTPQTVFAEGWVALFTREGAALRAARERLARVWDALQADPECRREATALRHALTVPPN